MTDRERLLEEVRELEIAAGDLGTDSFIEAMHRGPEPIDRVVSFAVQSAHHALTALALRDVMDQVDEFCVWPDADV